MTQFVYCSDFIDLEFRVVCRLDRAHLHVNGCTYSVDLDEEVELWRRRRRGTRQMDMVKGPNSPFTWIVD
jgi:hypothetical protein